MLGGTAAITTDFNPFDTDDNSTIPTVPEPTPDYFYNGTCECYYIRR